MHSSGHCNIGTWCEEMNIIGIWIKHLQVLKISQLAQSYIILYLAPGWPLLVLQMTYLDWTPMPHDLKMSIFSVSIQILNLWEWKGEFCSISWLRTKLLKCSWLLALCMVTMAPLPTCHSPPHCIQLTKLVLLLWHYTPLHQPMSKNSY